MVSIITESVNFLQDFLDRLIAFDKSCKDIGYLASEKHRKKEDDQRDELSRMNQEKGRIIEAFTNLTYKKEHVDSVANKKQKAFEKYETELQDLTKRDGQRRNEIYEKMTQAKFSENAPEVERLRRELFADKESIKTARDKIWQEYQTECAKILQSFESQQAQKNNEVIMKNDEAIKKDDEISKKKVEQTKDFAKFEKDLKTDTQKKIDAEIENLKADFNPEIIKNECAKILTAEPNLEDFKCPTKNPESVHTAELSYDLSSLKLDDRGFDILVLKEHYPDLYKNDEFNIPYSLAFDSSFNYLFDVSLGDTKGRETLINRACSLAMRLFMMIPPNKVNFTFFDPITLGETFALFTRLVDVDDRTSKVINGKIWTSTTDIDERLRILTDHIANVTQRCLQGQYENIQKYNADALQNAEPYQILMIMDFPGGFKEESLRKLEQIISTGPKCGVYTIILKIGEQIAKTDNKLKPLINNIEAKTMHFIVKGDEIVLGDNDKKYNGNNIPFHIVPLLSSNELNAVIPILKNGIKNAEKTVINFDDDKRKDILPDKNEWFKGNSSSELVIPIGIHGANNVQNIVFGTNAYHALIIGQTGSGKSSLLHTIIMSALVRYKADELSIFLVDFKRGVEFKIYANHRLDAFRAVAIESEREFGDSVLAFLDKEQSRRAELFRRENVDNIQAYRAKGKEGKNFLLPRILLIIDEFHVLFSRDGDTMGKNASLHLEQIIKQGRAFGIHVVLASQTMANVGGIHQSLWGQVGIRIALKCPPADAKLILSEDNDGVDLLASNEPGLAVYNSDCGNKIANTVFRVAYIEQDTQEGLLKKITDNAPKPEITFPDTRVMVSNIEDNLYHAYQKFINGGKPDEFKENVILIGEPLQLSGKLKSGFKAKENSNMLIIGNDAQKARAMFAFSSLSLAIHAIAQNNWKKTSKPCVHIMDFAPPEEDDGNVLSEMKEKIEKHVEYQTYNDSIEFLYELHRQLPGRKTESESQYLLMFGLQNARNIRQNGEPYKGKKQADTGNDDNTGLEIVQKQSPTPYQMLFDLLKEGPQKNIHTILWMDNFKTYQAHYSSLLSLFDLRIGFTMADEDSVLFIDEPNGSQISENNAVFSYNGNQKFRLYQMPNPDWLNKICKRINSF